MAGKTDIKEIFDLVFGIFQLDCRSYNESYMQRRINARIMANNMAPDDFGAYAALLRKDAQEQRLLYDALTINVTQFFRDIKLWDFLKADILPKLIEEKKEKSERSLNVWSCGSSSGEEAYSLAVLLKETLGARKDVAALVTGTDIDELSLAKAREAVYDINAFRSMPAEYFKKYFKPVNVKGSEKYIADPSLRLLVQFKRSNFLNDAPPLKSADIIFCRNVIIYFNPAAKDKLMDIFHRTLAPNGHLVLGKSEVLFTTKMQQRFYLYNVEERIYRKERRVAMVRVDVERRKNWWIGYQSK